MLPWRPQGVPRPQTPPRFEAAQPSSPETEDEDSEELSAPPQYVSKIPLGALLLHELPSKGFR